MVILNTSNDLRIFSKNLHCNFITAIFDQKYSSSKEQYGMVATLN